MMIEAVDSVATIWIMMMMTRSTCNDRIIPMTLETNLSTACTQIVLIVQILIWSISVLGYFLLLQIWATCWGVMDLGSAHKALILRRNIQSICYTLHIIGSGSHMLKLFKSLIYSSTGCNDLLRWFIRYHFLFFMNTWGSFDLACLLWLRWSHPMINKFT